jgi:hypothetical protein
MAFGGDAEDVSSKDVPLDEVHEPPEIGLKEEPFISVNFVGVLKPPLTEKESVLIAWPFANVPDCVLVRVMSIPPLMGVNSTVAETLPSESEPEAVNSTDPAGSGPAWSAFGSTTLQRIAATRSGQGNLFWKGRRDESSA